LHFYKKYSDETENISSIKKFIIFVVLVTSVAIISSYTAKFIKINSEGVKSIAYVFDDNSMEYRSIEKEITTFNAHFTLKNYSDEPRTFHISIDSPWSRRDNIPPIEIYNLQGKKAIFVLQRKEEKTFQINLINYMISGGKRSENGGFKGVIDELMLYTADEKNI